MSSGDRRAGRSTPPSVIPPPFLSPGRSSARTHPVNLFDRTIVRCISRPSRASLVWLASCTAYLLGLLFLALCTFSVAGKKTGVVIECAAVETAVTPQLQITKVTPVSVQRPAATWAGSAATAVAAEIDISALDRSELSPGDPVDVIDPGGWTGSNGLQGQLSQPVGRTPIASFCGVPSQGNSFVFLVDSSRSMAQGGLQQAKQELLRTIGSLRPHQRFQVVFYDVALQTMVNPATGEAVPQLMRATSANRKRLGNWMQQVETRQGKSPEAALRYAISLIPDAIFLLSDGDFSDTVVSQVRELNEVIDPIFGNHSLVSIHTVSLVSTNRSGGPRIQRMQRLAAENNGDHRVLVVRSSHRPSSARPGNKRMSPKKALR